jgi:hypothetical protein
MEAAGRRQQVPLKLLPTQHYHPEDSHLILTAMRNSNPTVTNSVQKGPTEYRNPPPLYLMTETAPISETLFEKYDDGQCLK